ncbi:MAG: LuxR C-terminal-related transcriptional regulator [Planctomycetota bacterium]|nr:LuxR C-terminal-related transcriptional regulator [Planctomycetota bacterium]
MPHTSDGPPGGAPPSSPTHGTPPGRPHRTLIKRDDFSLFDGIPGVGVLARGEDLRVLWCNEAYAEQCGTTTDKIVGTSIYDVLPRDMADERIALMRPVLETLEPVTYFQMYRGVRHRTRVWALDPSAFGQRGWFVVIEPAPIRGGPASRDVTEHAETVKSADLADLAVLTARELIVLRLIAEGLAVKQVAALLHRSEKTIENHVTAIHRKLGIDSRGLLVRFAVEHGITGFTREEWAQMVERIGQRDAD